MKKSKYKAIFFDAGGTLFKPDPSVGKIYAEVASKHGCRIEHRIIEEKFVIEWQKRDYKENMPKVMKEKQWWYDLVKDVFRGLSKFENFESFFEELYDVFARPEYWKVFPEAKRVIKNLKRSKLILGVVSNWDSRLEQLFDKLKLAQYFDFILASGVVGSSKPHEGIFLEALRRSGIKPHEALHVGDSMKDDIHGSSQIGIKSVLIDRSLKDKVHEGPQTAHHISTIKTLTKLLDIVFE